jgi:hypothetical protein
LQKTPYKLYLGGIGNPKLLGLVQGWSLVCALILMLSTYRIWLGPTIDGFPQIPAFQALCACGAAWDYAGLFVFGLAWLICFVNSFRLAFPLRPRPTPPIDSEHYDAGLSRYRAKTNGLSWLALLAGSLFLVSLNQHRLQAWFYQLMVYSLIFALAESDSQLTWLRRFVCSIYIYSALGKLDFEFAHTVGQQWVIAALNVLRIEGSALSELDLILFALLLPLVELLLAVGLIWQRTRRFAGSALFFFHLGLAMLLYTELQHSTGVVVWNLQFALQSLLLFALAGQGSIQPQILEPTTLNSAHANQQSIQPNANSSQPLWCGVQQRAFKILITLAMGLPVLERHGYFDHWPSWALYAPHTSRTQVTVARYARQQLPESLRKLLPKETDEQQASYLPLSEWSLKTTGAPIYPQDRFYLAVARYLVGYVDSSFSIEAQHWSAADRLTGQRKITRLKSGPEITRFGKKFWLNTEPRQTYLK